MTEDAGGESSPSNENNANSGEYTTASGADELVKSESASAAGQHSASADALTMAGSAGAHEEAASATASAVASADGYAMQRYAAATQAQVAGTPGSYDSAQYAGQYGQSYYGTAGSTAAGTGMYPFLYPHLYSAGHGGLHHHAGQLAADATGLVDDYNAAAVAAAAAAAAAAGGAEHARTADQVDHASQQAAAYSQMTGAAEDESQTGPIRGGYLKSEHGVWRPY